MKKSVSDLTSSLQSALTYEGHRQRVNDSKFRAVAQHMDYEGFRQLVLGADLKCTKAGEIERMSEARDSVFNSNFRQSESVAAPAFSRHTFQSVWRRTQDLRGRFEILKNLEETDRDTLLTTALEADFFAELVAVLTTVNDPSVGALVGKIKESAHYARSLKMLSRKERAGWEELVNSLACEDLHPPTE